MQELFCCCGFKGTMLFVLTLKSIRESSLEKEDLVMKMDKVNRIQN